MNRSLDELNTAFDALLARVNQLDGAGLSDASESTVAQVQAKIAGLDETVKQAVLTLDAHLNDLEKAIDDLRKALNNHLGVA
jgi:TolA-binding protein